LRAPPVLTGKRERKGGVELENAVERAGRNKEKQTGKKIMGRRYVQFLGVEGGKKQERTKENLPGQAALAGPFDKNHKEKNKESKRVAKISPRGRTKRPGGNGIDQFTYFFIDRSAPEEGSL